MPFFVAVIAGRSVAAFQATDAAAARERARERLFRDDLMVLENDHVPLWDGIADIEIRDARPNEAAKWRVSHARALRQGNIEQEDDAWIVFLIALTDSSRQPRRRSRPGAPFRNRR